MIKQIHWRSAAAAALIFCGGMAVLGAEWDRLRVFLRQSPAYFLGYWSIVLLFLVSALYIALLDIRYIRLKYFAEKRAIFRETLGDEVLREAIREAVRKRQAELIKSKRN